MNIRQKTEAPAKAADGAADDLNGDGWTRKEIALSAGLLVGTPIVWEIVVRVFEISDLIVPAPSSILDALRASFVSGAIFPHLRITLSEILAGFVLGAVAALVLGCLVAQFRIVDRIVYPYIVSFQAVPKIALAPLLVIWFGFGITSKIIMTALVAFFPILVNTVAGLKSVEQDRLELMRALNASRWQTFRYVLFPTALPFIFAGLDVGVVLAVIGAIVGEFVGASGGLGYLLLFYQAELKNAYVFAILIVLAAIGMALHQIIVFAQRRLVFWSGGASNRVTGI